MAEAKKTFNTIHDLHWQKNAAAGEWKNKWRTMRSYYVRSSEKTIFVERRNPVFNELGFLRPHMMKGEKIESRMKTGKTMNRIGKSDTISTAKLTKKRRTQILVHTQVHTTTYMNLKD